MSGTLINATGQELSNDMTCSSTIEPFIFGEEAENIFYDENCELDLEKRVDAIELFVQNNRSKINGVIIDKDSALGLAIADKLADQIQVVTSMKRPNSKLHWYWDPIVRVGKNSFEVL